MFHRAHSDAYACFAPGADAHPHCGGRADTNTGACAYRNTHTHADGSAGAHCDRYSHFRTDAHTGAARGRNLSTATLTRPH